MKNDSSDGRPKPKSWGERLSSLLRRSPSPAKPHAAASTAPQVAVSHPALYPKEVESLKKAYLRRLSEQLRHLHIYGLDARRHNMQESGQTLELAAIYVPLNTTLTTPVDEKEGEEGAARATGRRATRPVTLLEVAGRERRLLIRGAHGMGKSTFLRFVALSLAEGQVSRLGPTWQHGRLFPLLVPLRELREAGAEKVSCDDLCARMASALNIYPDQLVRQIIEPGGVLFLFDDLELATAAVAEFLLRFGETDNNFIVTAPEYLTPPEMSAFVAVTLAPWNIEQVDMFAHRWYAELERQGWVDEETARDMPGHLRSAVRRDEVASLAGRPSLMTLIATLHTRLGDLPSSPVEFYRELFDLTVNYWSEGKTEEERDLRQLFDGEGLRDAVAQATYNGYSRLQGPADLVELPEKELRATLIQACRNGRWEAVNSFMERVLARPGLLDEREPGVYSYINASLQAYVAARHLMSQPDLARLVRRLAQEDFWRPVILFAASRFAYLRGNLAAVAEIVDALCPRPLPDDEEPGEQEWRLAWLAGEVLSEVAPADYGGTLGPLIARVKEWLVALLERGRLEPAERAQVGGTLDRLPSGDPRPGVSEPEPLWCWVPASPFWQGDGDEARMVELDSFWIARYLVTNAQYAAFVRATGRRPPSHWRGEEPPAGIGNHPVVYVTWQDALAFCHWCTERLRSSRLLVWRSGRVVGATMPAAHWTVRLPTSAEWEKAARGGTLIPSPESGELIENPMPRRIYPWGDSWQLSIGGRKGDETRCNVSESEIGSTTPVGIYPDGASPYGLMDMAGNVWEWCLDWADDEHRYKVRRGGAFRYTHEHARCSAHDRAYPGLAWPYLGFRIVLGPPVAETRP